MNDILIYELNRIIKELLEEKIELEKRFANGDRSEKLFEDMAENFINFVSCKEALSELELMMYNYFNLKVEYLKKD